MILKDDELVIIGLINEDKIEGRIALKEVKSVFYDLIQVGPMYRTFAAQLENEKKIAKGVDINTVDLSYYEVF